MLDVLLKNIRRRLTPQPMKIRADFELTCFQYEGVDAIKAALLKSMTAGTEDLQIKVKLVAPPLYVMSAMSPDKDKGIAALQKGLELMRTSITESKGELNVKVAPRAVGEREDKALALLMSQLDQANKEVRSRSVFWFFFWCKSRRAGQWR